MWKGDSSSTYDTIGSASFNDVVFYGFSGKFTSAGSYSTIIFRGTESSEHCIDIPDVLSTETGY